MNKRLIIVLLGCLIVFGGVFGMKYMGSKAMNQYFDNMPVPPVTISATTVKPQAWTQSLEAVGTLRAVNGIQVTSEVAGKVEALHFESGQRVEEGTVLVELDAKTDRADLKTYEAQSRLANTDLERLRKLYKLESISKADLDRAESEAAQARARVLTQKARIDQKTIRAPFTGELGIRQVDLGQYIDPGTTIVTLQALDSLYVDFTLPEQHLARVKPQQEVRVRVDALDGEVLNGKIQAVETRVDPETRNFPVRAELPNPEGRLRPGMFARVNIALPEREQVILVPRTAISYNAYGNSVFVVTEKTVEPSQAEGNEAVKAEAAQADEPRLIVRQRFVKTGEGRGDYVVVESGLTEGERIATSGLLKLRNDQPVKINNELAPDTSLNPAPADT
ncbi:MAG: efflux RND transporter periplasmic adaptor subunit [Salinisphaeraceae bacterium]|nr:efflux RND transporter periplasmic adaptor subunit [Salinisphaeraceae bacterium]